MQVGIYLYKDIMARPEGEILNGFYYTVQNAEKRSAILLKCALILEEKQSMPGQFLW